jgi:hypothetical protein
MLEFTIGFFDSAIGHFDQAYLVLLIEFNRWPY